MKLHGSVGKVLVGIIVAIAVSVAPTLIAHRRMVAATTDLPRPPIQIQLGKVRPPLPIRIVSFHHPWANRRLIRLAAQLGFNGVQFQIEGSTVDGIKQFAQYDAQEHLVDFCHSLGMSVTVWVHELSDLPPPWMPDSIGPVGVDNDLLWQILDDRYEWILHDAIPNVDGLCLTVVETQIRATDTGIMLKLCDLLRRKCQKYNKSLMVRTFVWYPSEYTTVMAAVNQLPSDTLIMSKCVPQDWNLRGDYAAEIGKVGGRPQIIEYDVAGEYFLRNYVANCMPQLLKRHMDYDMQNNISGICVRVDRENDDVLNQPNEVNLWTLALLADGASDNLDEIWKAWAVSRFGDAAADGVIKALKPTGDVVAEMLSIGPFTLGDTRLFPPPLGDEDFLGQQWQNWWWSDRYTAAHQQAETGDAKFIAQVRDDKIKAAQLAQQSLNDLDSVRDRLKPQDYEILRTRLLTNQLQLAIRAPMAMAVLHYRALLNAQNDQQKQDADQAITDDLAALRTALNPDYTPATQIQWLGQNWTIGPPQDVPLAAIYYWAYEMDLLRQGIDPRPPLPKRFGQSRLQPLRLGQ